MLGRDSYEFPKDVDSVCLFPKTVLFSQMKIVIHAAYGSTKDIAVYSGLGVGPNATFFIGHGKSKRNEKLATVSITLLQWVYDLESKLYYSPITLKAMVFKKGITVMDP